MGTKMAVALANIFKAKIEREILRQSNTKPIFWKRFIDDIISLSLEGKQLPSYNQIHGRNIRNRDDFLKRCSVQRRQIPQRIYT